MICKLIPQVIQINKFWTVYRKLYINPHRKIDTYSRSVKRFPLPTRNISEKLAVCPDCPELLVHISRVRRRSPFQRDCLPEIYQLYRWILRMSVRFPRLPLLLSLARTPGFIELSSFHPRTLLVGTSAPVDSFDSPPTVAFGDMHPLAINL